MENSKMVKIVFSLKDGLVDQVLSTEEVVVAVIDHDTDGVDVDDLIEVPALEPVGPEVEEVCAPIRPADVKPELVEQMFAAMLG
jgi:hypothetical protein